jgi:D-sedoheptulose 7-phosphate isomerase
LTQLVGSGVVERALDDRTHANRAFFESEADRLARLCHRMAERFARGGRLIAFGRSPSARSDARHVAVEFVHPVIVGKRALPAIGLAGEGGALPEQVALVAEPDDIAIGFGADEDGGEAAAAIALARERGCLTLAFAPAGAEWEFEPPGPDAPVRQELVETLYHVLWELVHVFFDHRGLLEGRSARPTHDAGASSFLYPFLAEREDDLEAVVADVRGSVLAKAEEVGALRAQTLTDNRGELIATAAELRRDLDAGGRLLALGNGGSATDAMDVVADFRRPPDPRWQSRRALDLTEDAAILTAIANDIGTEAIFARQVIAHGRDGDALLAISTSGNSANVIAALAEARSRGLRTMAMVGYDGGRVAAEQLADHVVVTRSEHIPRIQEAQASAYHVLRELVG